MVSPGQLLRILPPFENRATVIADQQVVHDIIKEVLSSHEFFATDYDAIASYFERDTVVKTCKALFNFCKENIHYEIETEESQTTRSPAAFLAIGTGDCKHYAGFIGGVLDALKRKGYKINWCYRFASYDLFNSTPGHVFVVVKDNGNELWVDPVLERFNERLKPTYITDKKVSMLQRLSGLEITDEPINYSVSDYLNNAQADSMAYNNVQTLLKYGVMNADMSLNDDLMPALEATLPQNEFSRLQSARISTEKMAISGLGENIAHALAKVTLAIPRAAYLSLVGLNVFGLANKLWNCIFTDESGTTYYQPGQDKIYHAWYLSGGDWDKLLNTVKHGKKNKAILGVAPAIPVWVASATVIIAALGAAISQILKSRSDQTGVNYNLDPATGLPYGSPASTPYSSGNSIMSFIQNNPLLVAGVVLGGYYLYKNRRA